MADKPAPEKSGRTKFNHLQSDPVSIKFKPFPMLAQFSAVPAPVPAPAPAPQSASASASASTSAPVPESAPAPAPQSVSTSAPVPVAESAPAPAPQSASASAPVPVAESTPVPTTTQASQPQAQTTVQKAVETPSTQVNPSPTNAKPVLAEGFVLQTVNSTKAPSTTTAASNSSASAESSSGSASSKPTPAVPKPLVPLPYQSINATTFKGAKYVSLDGLQTDTRDIYDKISGTYQWEACENGEEHCVSFIKDKCANKRVFLVSAGGLGSRVVPKIHDLPQLYAVYIYCVDVEGHKKWANNFSKVRVVCDDDDRFLLPQFAVDVAQMFIEWGDALLEQGKRDKAKEKYAEAHLRLSEHARHHDPAIDVDLKQKMARCQ